MATYKKLLKNRKGDVIIPVTDLMSDFSTSEVNTGCKWTDGKPIYKKTIDFGQLPNATGKSVATGITNLGQIVDLYGVATYANGVVLLLPYIGIPDTTASISVNMNNANVTVTTGTDRRGATAYITILYTKTTG